MIIIDSVVDSVKSELINNIFDPFISVKLSYEKNILPNPLKKIYIILNPSKITVLPYSDEHGVYTNRITFKIGVNIHISESSNPQRLLTVFTQVVNVMNDSVAFSLEESGCTEIKSDSTSNSLYLPGYITFSVLC